MDNLEELKSDLLTTKYTKVYKQSKESQNYGASHRYEVRDVTENILAYIHFQEGPIKECGVNGVCNEDLINMVIDRLKSFQDTKFNCKENAMAITKLEEALLWLRKRTTARELNGTEGTHRI